MGRRKRKRRKNQEVTNTTLVCEKEPQTAAEFVAKGDYKAALRLLLEEPFPDDAQQRLAAECHFQIGEDAQAADIVARIEAKLPSDLVLMGKYLLHAQQWVEAEKALRFALSVDRSVSVPARKWASIPEPGEPHRNVAIPVGDHVRWTQMADRLQRHDGFF